MTPQHEPCVQSAVEEAGSHQARIPAQIAFVPNKEGVDSPGCIFTALSCDRR